MRQPKWHRWETILLINSYFKIKDKGLDPKKECTRLSELLRQIGEHDEPTYRNIEGVLMKYENIRYLDTGKGLSGYSQLDQEIFNLYKNNYAIYVEELKMVNDLLRIVSR